MGQRVLIDSNVIIDLLNGVDAARKEIQEHTDIAISAVTWIEVMTGVRPGEEEDTRRFLGTLDIVPVTNTVMEETVRVRQTTRLKLADAMILATAHVQERVLLTRNSKDFAPGRYVRLPYSL